MQTQGDTDQQISEIKQLLSQGNEIINRQVEKAVLMMGKTGSGKSSIANIFAGLKIQVKYDQSKGTTEIIGEGISSGVLSETKIPRDLVRKQGDQENNNITIWDCPGFSDTNGITQEIANSFYNKKLMENIKKVKIIIVFNESLITQNRGDDFVQQLNNFTEMFKSVGKICKSCVFLINFVQQNQTQDHFKNYLSRILKDNMQMTQKSKEILEYVIDKNSIYLLIRITDQNQIFDCNDLFLKLYNSIEYSNILDLKNSTQGFLNNAISSNALKYALPLFDQSQSLFMNQLKKLEKLILDKSKQIIEQQSQNKKDDSIYSKLTVYFQKFQGHSQDKIGNEIGANIKSYKQLLDLDNLSQLRGAIDTFLLKEIIGSEEIKESIITLFSVLEGNYLEDEHIKQSIEDRKILLENLEFLVYFVSVCKVEINYKEIKNLFDKTKGILEQGEQTCVNNINLIIKGQNYQYYKSIFEHFQKHKRLANDKSLLLKNMANAKYYMGLIKFDENRWLESLSEFMESLKLSNLDQENRLSDIFEKISIIISNDNQALWKIDDQDILKQIFKVYQNKVFIIQQQVAGQIKEALQIYDQKDTLIYLQDINELRLQFKDLKYLLPEIQIEKIINQFCNMIDFIQNKFMQMINNAFNVKNDFTTFFSGMGAINNHQNNKKFKQGMSNWFQLLEEPYDLIRKQQRLYTRRLDRQEIGYNSEDIDYLKQKVELVKLLPNDIESIQVHAKLLYQIGCIYRKKNSSTNALKYLENAIKIDNGQNQSRKLIAQIFYEDQQYEQAIPYFQSIRMYNYVEKCYDMKVNNTEQYEQTKWLLSYANFLEKVNNYQLAIQKLFQAMSIYAENFNEENVQFVAYRIQKISLAIKQCENEDIKKIYEDRTNIFPQMKPPAVQNENFVD